ncbi:MAG TPA: hypothetical protein VFT02_13805 [Pyrinomonadaceae bacterium]|nr:hypothetical protein [Pyrinomonadaceae bacterium]
MTDGADWWTCAAEELGAMAAYAGVVIGVVRDVGVSGGFGPVFGWGFVTGVAGGFVFGCCVGELGVVDGAPRVRQRNKD